MEIERLESRDTPSASGFQGIFNANLAMPPQAQAAVHSQVCFDAVVVTPESGPPTVTCPDGGFVPPGQVLGALTGNHNETLVRDRARTVKPK